MRTYWVQAKSADLARTLVALDVAAAVDVRDPAAQERLAVVLGVLADGDAVAGDIEDAERADIDDTASALSAAAFSGLRASTLT